MDVIVYTGELAAAAFDLVVLGAFEGEPGSPAFRQLDRALGGALTSAASEEHFQAKDKQVLVVTTLGRLRAKRVALLGLGKRQGFAEAGLVGAGARAARLARDVSASTALVWLPEPIAEPAAAGLVARGAALGTYAYERYKSEKSGKRPARRMALAAAGKPGAFRRDVARAAVVAEAVALARDLVNEPALDLYPETFAARARAVAREARLAVKVLGPREMERLGMRLLLGVGSGSSRTPRFVHLSYRPRGRARRVGPLCLVGKGITFDSGGLSLKPPAGMEDMKADMAGAAAVLAAMRAVATLAPDAEVHGLLALAENMPSGTAVRPGDVIRGAGGKSVEVVNTDAEGRLVLADALSYARGLAPRAIIDVATLTGACAVALGPHTTGVFSNDDALAARVLEASRASGESFWRLPLTRELRAELKSDVADLRNTGAREGGAITAALFLSEFVGDTPWAHLDIAGPAMVKHGRADGKGATGVAVPTLVALAAP